VEGTRIIGGVLLTGPLRAPHPNRYTLQMNKPNKYHTIDWFPYQLGLILFLLGLGIYYSLKSQLPLLTVALSIISLWVILAFLGWLKAPNYLEKALITYLKKNGGELPRKSIDEYFIVNFNNDIQEGINASAAILKRLEERKKVLVQNNVVKLNV